MRRIEDNWAENFIKKHRIHKMWVVFALCVTLLTGPGTLYLLNKPATAMTEDGASSLGLVLETADAEFEQGIIRQMEEEEAGDEEPVKEEEAQDKQGEEENPLENQAEEESTEEKKTEEESTKEETPAKDSAAEEMAEEENTEEKKAREENTEEEKSEEESTKKDKSKEESADKEKPEKEDTEEKKAKEGSTEKDKSKEEVTQDKKTKEESTKKDKSGKDSLVKDQTEEDIEQSEKTANDKALAKDQIKNKEKSTMDSENEKKLADKKALEGKELLDEKALEGKELLDEKALEKDVVLTARYVDTKGESIADDKEMHISESFDTTTEVSEFEGYIFKGAAIEDEEFSLLTAALDEETGYKYFKAALKDETKDIKEDAEVVFTYIKLSEETEFSFDNDRIVVKATLNDNCKFPEGVELKATEVTSHSEDYNFDAYMGALNDNACEIAKDAGFEETCEYTEHNTVLYDIAFMLDGKEFQPAEGAVNISIEFKDNKLSDELSAKGDEEIAVVHLPIRDEVKEASEIETTEGATEIESSDIKVITLTDASVNVGSEEKVEFMTDSFSVFAVISYQSHEAGTDDFKSVLGDAINFGIVANELAIGESETNFAVGKAVTKKQFGNDLTNPMEQTFMAGELSGNLLIKGYKAYFILPSDYTGNIKHQNGWESLSFDTAYSKEQIHGVVKDMLTYTRTASKELAGRQANVSLKKDEKYNGRWAIDTTTFGPGTYYVDYDDDMASKINTGDDLRIYKNSDQTIVFNVKTSSTYFHIQKFHVTVDGGNDDDSASLNTITGHNATKTIIWNFINATEVDNDGSSVVGVFLAGQENAKWTNKATSAGWLAFPNVEIDCGEWHNTYDNVQQISATAQFQAYKKVDDEDAKVTGFKFTLYKKTEDGWEAVESAYNGLEDREDGRGNKKDIKADNAVIAPKDVVFSAITYGNDSSMKGRSNYQYTSVNTDGAFENFVYRICETNGTSDKDGNSYNADENDYYAKVTVTCRKINSHTNSTYYQVSAPVYYTDEACTQPCTTGLPIFKNTTSRGELGITIYKYINGINPGNRKFKFTVKVLKPVEGTTNKGVLETLTDSLENDGSLINYSFNYGNSYIYNGCIYLVVSENDITNASSDLEVQKDEGFVVVRVDKPGKPNQEIRYYKASKDVIQVQRLKDPAWATNTAEYVTNIAKGRNYYINPKEHEAKAAFFNTGTGKLRIHKMVVNEFGSSTVRDFILNHVVFRITNNETGERIILTGFADKKGKTQQVTGFKTDGTTATYNVICNENAQWTIDGLPAGTYTVEEVADGVTFTYDEEKNTSTRLDNAPYTRVTKYGVTIDEETGTLENGIGGGNKRAIFSSNVPDKSDDAPDKVRVDGDTRTVQVCNYYSLPVGPIRVAKNFSGADWGNDMSFTFKIEALEGKALDNDGSVISTGLSPLPVSKTATVNKSMEKGGMAIAEFESIPYKYLGEYRYKITEDATNPIQGVTYDKRAYYVKVVVSRKYQSFLKSYTYSKQLLPMVDSTTDVTEDFWYLGADIYYYSDEQFTKEITKCELTLEKDSSGKLKKSFTEKYKDKTSAKDVVFTNTMAGELTVSKLWLDADGNNASDKYTKLELNVMQRAVGEKEWKLYQPVVLTKDSNDNGIWTHKITGLPLKDKQGVSYEYMIQEPDSYRKNFTVSYNYKGTDYYVNQKGTLTAVSNDGSRKECSEYLITTDGIDFGTVTITNKSIFTNKLPETGGEGTAQYAAFGVLFFSIAVSGLLLIKMRDRF